jgi:hypothetical protein
METNSIYFLSLKTLSKSLLIYLMKIKTFITYVKLF